MFDVAALAIEALTGKNFEVVVKEKILDPLGMAGTSFTGTAGVDVAMGLTPRLEKGELKAGEGIAVGVGPDTGLQSLGKMGRGSYGLISTAEDMVRPSLSRLTLGQMDRFSLL
jgi:CubicO group peptidase (beta-lactamase class C family)